MWPWWQTLATGIANRHCADYPACTLVDCDFIWFSSFICRVQHLHFHKGLGEGWLFGHAHLKCFLLEFEIKTSNYTLLYLSVTVAFQPSVPKNTYDILLSLSLPCQLTSVTDLQSIPNIFSIWSQICTLLPNFLIFRFYFGREIFVLQCSDRWLSIEGVAWPKCTYRVDAKCWQSAGDFVLQSSSRSRMNQPDVF